MSRFRALARSWFIRRTADHQNRPGFAVYLLVGVAVFALGWAAVKNFRGNNPVVGAGRPNPQAKAKVETDRIAGTAARNTPPRPLQNADPNPLKTSERDRTASPPPIDAPPAVAPADGASVLDTVRLATGQRQPKSTSQAGLPEGFIDEGDTALKAQRVEVAGGASTRPITPVTTGTPIAVGPPLQVQVTPLNLDSLVIYGGDPPAKKADTAKQRQRRATTDLLPLGTEFPVVFMDKIQTLDLEGLVRLQVVGTVKSPSGKVQIPNGAFIFATAAKKNIRGRVGVTLQTLVFRDDGRQVSLQGIVKDEDGQPGVLGVYVPAPRMSQAISFLTPVATGFLESRKQTQASLGVGPNGALQTTTVANPYDFRNQMLTAAENGLTEELRKKQQELDELHRPYVEIKKGTWATVQLTRALDIAVPEESGFLPTNPSAPAISAAGEGAVKKLGTKVEESPRVEAPKP